MDMKKQPRIYVGTYRLYGNSTLTVSFVTIINYFTEQTSTL
jgi:hypothetical protein